MKRALTFGEIPAPPNPPRQKKPKVRERLRAVYSYDGGPYGIPTYYYDNSTSDWPHNADLTELSKEFNAVVKARVKARAK